MERDFLTAFIKLKTIGHGEYVSVSLDCLKTLKLVHAMIGAFGVVSLVREQTTGKFFAMK